MSKYSTISVEDILMNSSLCPIKVYVDDILIFDDTGDSLFDITRDYLDLKVSSFEADIQEYHHTFIKIYTVDYCDGSD